MIDQATLRAHKLTCQLRQQSAQGLLTEAQRTDEHGRTTSPLAPYRAIYARIATDYDLIIESIDRQLAALPKKPRRQKELRNE